MKIRTAPLPVVGFVAAVLILAAAQAREDWYRELDLEAALDAAELVLVVRVAEITEDKIVHGGKGESVIRQYKFEPLRTLKGLFARPVLSLTNSDLGIWHENAGIERGQARLLLLARSGPGYCNASERDSVERSVPLLKDENDALLKAVEALIAVTQQPDRGKKTSILLDALPAKGPAAIPLLVALRRRAPIAAQTPGASAKVGACLGDDLPAVREAAARTLSMLLDADYLGRMENPPGTVKALVGALQRADRNLNARVAALEALGHAGASTLGNPEASGQLQLNAPSTTFAELAARLRSIGRLNGVGAAGVPARPDGRQLAAVSAFMETLQLDAPDPLERAGAEALRRLDPPAAARQAIQRLKSKLAAGLPDAIEISELAELPADVAVPALLECGKLEMEARERAALAQACGKLADARLAPLLVALLEHSPQVRWHAVEALLKIDTPEAARSLAPHLRGEQDLRRKLKIAEVLGRHGNRDGYPYAIEHMSEPDLREQAVAALGAIREPKALEQLRGILEQSNNVNWNSAAILALGKMGAKDFAPKFLEHARNLKNPLAPAALVALGDLGELQALGRVAEGLASRNTVVVGASARAAAKLAGLPAVDARTSEAVREQLAALLTDADAEDAVRQLALDALLALGDRRLDRALAAAALGAGIERTALLAKVEKLLSERKVALFP